MGDGTIGFDRTRLRWLRSATADAADTAESLRARALDDETGHSLGLAIGFLRHRMLPSIDATLSLDVFDRPVRLEGLAHHVPLVRTSSNPGMHTTLACRLPTTLSEAPADRPFANIDDDELIEQLTTLLHHEHAAHRVDHPFWTGTGQQFLTELRHRLAVDPGFVVRLTGSPVALPAAARLLGTTPALAPVVARQLAVAVLASPVPGHLEDTALAADAVSRASATISADDDHRRAVLTDPDALAAIMKRGHVGPEVIGEWLGGEVKRLDDAAWPDATTIEVIGSFATFLHEEPLGHDTPPAELAVPLAVLTVAAMPLLADGRTPSGPYLYPTVDGHRSEHHAIDRRALRELIGTTLRDPTGAATVFVGLRTTLRDAVASDHPELEVSRVDEIARIVDEAIEHERAEIAALEAARVEWVSSMLGGLDKLAHVAARHAGTLAGSAAAVAVDGVQAIGVLLVDEQELPFTSTRAYYEMSRSFEIGRVAVLDAPDDPARVGALAVLDRIDAGIDDNLDGAVHRANLAWLDFEDASQPFVEPGRFPDMSW